MIPSCFKFSRATLKSSTPQLTMRFPLLNLCRSDQYYPCQSFLLAKLKTKIQARNDPSPRWLETWCCCLVGFWRVMSHSVLSVVFQAIWEELQLWLHRCRHTCCPKERDVESAGSGKEDGSQGTKFVVVEFNAWECAGSDVLWAALITKIFDEVWGDGYICTSRRCESRFSFLFQVGHFGGFKTGELWFRAFDGDISGSVDCLCGNISMYFRQPLSLGSS